MPRSTSRSSSVQACIGLGANLGDARTTLAAAIEALRALPQSALHAVSSVWRSAPIDSSGPDYLNAVALIETRLAPQALLEALQRIERTHGRERPYRNAPRTLDLDLLLYGDVVLLSAMLGRLAGDVDLGMTWTFEALYAQQAQRSPDAGQRAADGERCPWFRSRPRPRSSR